ncbi:MAG: uridylate kinase [Christensenellaceae bacterium]|nr:uridylate kinase [Christensenellaceae bacterium]
MSHFDFDAVVKIGSMALIRKEDNDLDYNIFSRLAHDLRPGYILVSSGATEIGRIDYMKRNGSELKGDMEEIKADYAAQGQAVLMELYRQFINPRYSVRQVLVEHSHFNDKEKAEHIRKMFFRAANQNAIPIVNYNDPVSNEENRKMEIAALRRAEGKDEVVECIDNDETAAVVTQLVHAEKMVLLTSTEGIYREVGNPDTLIEEVRADSMEELTAKIDEMLSFCHGASRVGAAGAKAKLTFARKPLEDGTRVIIANAKHRLSDILNGNVRCTRLQLNK